MTIKLEELAMAVTNPTNSSDDHLAARHALEDFHGAATPAAVLNLIKDRDQQRVAKFRARYQRDATKISLEKELIEALQLVQKWHSAGIKTLTDMAESDGDPISLVKGDESIELTGEKLKGFKIGLLLTTSFLRKLPFNLNENEAEEDAES